MKYLFMLIFALLFTGCDYIKVNSCQTDSAMTSLLKGDTLSNDTQETYIKIVQTSTHKEICTTQGSAHIFRP